MKHTSLLVLASAVIIVTTLGGCRSMMMSGVTRAGTAIAEERSIGDVIDDTTIWADIKSRFYQADLNHIFAGTNVTVNEGRVLITGSVEDPIHRVESTKLAWSAPGVKEVINEVQVAENKGLLNFANDYWINTQVQTKLLLDQHVHSMNYNVDTINGVVYLVGIAQDEGELDRATYIASQIKGVERVISHMRLKESPLRLASR